MFGSGKMITDSSDPDPPHTARYPYSIPGLMLWLPVMVMILACEERSGSSWLVRWRGPRHQQPTQIF